MAGRCNLTGGPFADPCMCHEYRGAVRARVHAKALREHRESNRLVREENEVYERDEAKSLVAQTGNREEAIAESLRTVGLEQTKERFGWIPDDLLRDYHADAL